MSDNDKKTPPCPFCFKAPEEYVIGARPAFNEPGTRMVRCKTPSCAIWNRAISLTKWMQCHKEPTE